MEFRLIYKGRLPAEKWSFYEEYARAEDKQRLRKHFHLQLRELWKQHPDLRRQAERLYIRQEDRVPDRTQIVAGGTEIGSNNSTLPPTYSGLIKGERKTWLQHIASDYARLGTHFVPLISEAGGFTCSLDILFLRRDNPGNLIHHGGDIDSRVKVLFDGLRMPKRKEELGNVPIDADEDPFYCLLEDDTLVTQVSVTTDRLIIPQESTESIHDVFLVIHVTVVNPSAIFAGGRVV